MKQKNKKIKGWYKISPLHSAVKEYKTIKPTFKNACIVWRNDVNDFFVSFFSRGFKGYEVFKMDVLTDYLKQ